MHDAESPQDLRDLVDGAIRGKEVACIHFAQLSGCMEDPHLRQELRRLAQEEWDHRKILVKHRRSLFGRTPRSPAEVSCPAPYAPMAERPELTNVNDLARVLDRAVRCELDAHVYFKNASSSFHDRAVKVYLRILAEECLSQAAHLRGILHLLEKHPFAGFCRTQESRVRRAIQRAGR
jgi:rubrerythrin